MDPRRGAAARAKLATVIVGSRSRRPCPRCCGVTSARTIAGRQCVLRAVAGRVEVLDLVRGAHKMGTARSHRRSRVPTHRAGPTLMTVVERLALPFLRASGWSRRYVSTRAGRLHVLELEGQGKLPPVVLLHGITSNGVTLAGLAKKLAPFVSRVIAPDLPAHGFSSIPSDGLTPRSMTEGAFDLLDRVVSGPMLLVGNSMGGLVATRYAAARPNRVAGLALVSPGGAPMAEADFQRFLDTFRIQTYAQALHFVDLVFAKPPPLIRHFIARGVMSRFQHPSLRHFLDSTGSEDLLRVEEVAGLQVPTLFIWGHEERVLRPEHLRFWSSTLPTHAQQERWLGFGHIGIHEQEARLAGRLGSWAAEAVAARGAHIAHSDPAASTQARVACAPVLRITPQAGTLAASA